MRAAAPPRAPLAAGLVAALALVACGGQGGCRASASAGADAGAAPLEGGLAAVTPPPLDGGGPWALAAEGEADDLSSLARHEGAAGLAEQAEAVPGRRLTALAALAYADGTSGVPYLARRLDEGSEAEAKVAGASLVDVAARPRRAEAPEDAAELREACDRLLALAREPKKARARRVAAVRALRMLADRGCVKREDVPVDVDAP